MNFNNQIFIICPIKFFLLENPSIKYSKVCQKFLSSFPLKFLSHMSSRCVNYSILQCKMWIWFLNCIFKPNNHFRLICMAFFIKSISLWCNIQRRECNIDFVLTILSRKHMCVRLYFPHSLDVHHIIKWAFKQTLYRSLI